MPKRLNVAYSEEVKSKAIKMVEEGLSHAEVGRRLNITSQTIGKWCNQRGVESQHKNQEGQAMYNMLRNCSSVYQTVGQIHKETYGVYQNGRHYLELQMAASYGLLERKTENSIEMFSLTQKGIDWLKK